MSQERTVSETVSLLEDFGLKEYEARCFVGLARLSGGTAREVSDVSEVPRTRVYDAVHALESLGLVEVQHGSPKRFRAVDVSEASRTLRRRHLARIDELTSRLEELERPVDERESISQEVWSLAGHDAIQTRTEETVAEAASEIVLLVVEEALLTDELVEHLRAAQDRGATVIVGGATDAIVARVRAELPGAETFETELAWLMGPEDDDEVAISRVLLVDRTTLLVGSYYPHDGDPHDERAVFTTGLGNGVVVLLRRLVASGLLPARDPRP